VACTRIYFCSDIHASDKCWKKFLGTAKFYGADVIIVGGDITGKFLVPIVSRNATTTSAISWASTERCPTATLIACSE
jgi:Icc-related predicted phosphoesterase